MTATKDGRVFDSSEFHSYAAVFFFTTGDLTTAGERQAATDDRRGKANITRRGARWRARICRLARGQRYVSHTDPIPKTWRTGYIAHGEQSDPYLRMLGGEFIIHGRDPRLQTTNIIVNDPKFPGLEGVTSPVSFTDEWYSLKDFATDMHVILTLDTNGMKGEPYQRPPYPMTWARMHGKGRVFFTAIGDRPENWEIPFFVNLLGGGIRWALGDVNAKVDRNITQAAPGYAVIPPKNPPAAK